MLLRPQVVDGGGQLVDVRGQLVQVRAQPSDRRGIEDGRADVPAQRNPRGRTRRVRTRRQVRPRRRWLVPTGLHLDPASHRPDPIRIVGHICLDSYQPLPRRQVTPGGDPPRHRDRARRGIVIPSWAAEMRAAPRASRGMGRLGDRRGPSSRWPRWTAGATSGSGSTVGRAVVPGASTRRQVVLTRLGRGCPMRCNGKVTLRLAGLWLRWELRRRWQPLVLLVVLVALSAGTLLAAVVGARRGASAADRLVERRCRPPPSSGRTKSRSTTGRASGRCRASPR